MYNKSTEGYGRRTIDGGGAIKCKGLPHTPRGQSRGDRFYIENKICAMKTVTVWYVKRKYHQLTRYYFN